MPGQSAKACVKPTVLTVPVSIKVLPWQWQENNNTTINCKYIMHD